MFRSDLFILLVFGSLVAGCSTRTEEPREDRPLIAVQVIIESSWPPDAVTDQLVNATKRFAECGVTLAFAQERGGEARGVLAFVPSLEAVGGQPIEGRALTLRTPKRAEIAWAAPGGAPLDHKQTVAHELGHLFGLRHAFRNAINLMVPHGCEFCRFTAGQCQVIAKTAVKMSQAAHPAVPRRSYDATAR